MRIQQKSKKDCWALAILGHRKLNAEMHFAKLTFYIVPLRKLGSMLL